jgi:tRNA-specific 2-thiouridylase
MKTRVVAAMSGGVDSSVAAALLQNQGDEVIGITMCFGLKESDKKRPSCCGIEGIEDARRVAHKLGIRHYVLNFDKALEEKVIKNFISEYLSGRTPNPCIRCNEYLKFQQLLNKARGLQAKYLATGHYARIEFDKNKKIFRLKKAKDKFKDQSYFLYRITQKQMAHILMPLGNLTKDRVRKLASDLGLSVADKPGSQEICFIPDDDYREFLKTHLPAGRQGLTRISSTPVPLWRGIDADIKSGLILDTKGNILGKHRGIPFYTIGQREGLGIAMGYPVYVTKIDARNNTIIAGKKEEAFSYGLIAGDLSFTYKAIKRAVALNIKIRYNHKEVSSRIIPLGRNRVKAIFSKPQFAVTPGQSAVFYKRQEVIGGGIIEKGLNHAEAH